MVAASTVGIVAGAGAVGWATMVEPHWCEVTHRPLAMMNLPDALVGKRMIQISDLHIGRTDFDYLCRTIQMVNELRPDMIMLTGDYIDRAYPEAIEDVARVVGSLTLAPMATVACLGNHDYGYRWSQLEVADRVAGSLTDLGITVLRDEQIEVGGMNIFGMEDYWSIRHRPRRKLRVENESMANLCLCHNPDVCDKDVWGNFSGVVLSGHTHGGQCKPPFFGPPFLPVANYRYVSGFYDVGSGRTLCINRGLGHSLKARFNCRPEITVFTLARAGVPIC